MKSLHIPITLHDQLLRWAVCSRREINVVCFGIRDQITKVVRLRNPERFGRYSASINNREYRDVTRQFRRLKVVACGHSHIGGPARPSKGDMPPTIAAGKIELIICTRSKTITAWRIRKSLAATIKRGRIQVVVIQNDKSQRNPISSYVKRKGGSSHRVANNSRKKSG